MEFSGSQEIEDAHWMKERILYLENELELLKKTLLKTEVTVTKRPEIKKKSKKLKYQSFDDLITAFDDTDEEIVNGKSPLIDTTTVNTTKFLYSHINWNKRIGESKLRTNHELLVNFFSCPWYQESFMTYALFLCIDVILYMFSYLFIRSAIFVLYITDYVIHVGRHSLQPISQKRSLFFDFTRLILMCIGCVVVSSFDLSYHYIRSISGFKVYLIFNILGTFESLLTSIEHNVADALYYSTRRSFTWRTFSVALQDFLFAVVFISALASVKFLNFVTFNVAMNMNTQTYIIYTISRKFKYLKKTIYKKYDEINLFDHCCRDIEEKLSFALNAVLSALLLYRTNDLSLAYLYQVLLLFLVDEGTIIFKHMILLKQNRWSPCIYNNYKAVLKRDYLLSVDYDYDLDRTSQHPTHVVAERLEISVISTSSVLLSCAFSYLFLPFYRRSSLLSLAGVLLLVIAVCAALKLLSSYLLLRMAKTGTHFVEVTTVDKEIVATKQQIGESPKGYGIPSVKSQSDLQKKMEWSVC